MVVIFHSALCKPASSSRKPSDEHQKPMSDTWKMRGAQRSMSIDNINFLSSATSTLKPSSQQQQYDDEFQQYEQNFEDTLTKQPTQHQQHQQQRVEYDSGSEIQKEDDDDNIIPWKKLLRKTNSRLNLIS
jgi:transketolase